MHSEVEFWPHSIFQWETQARLVLTHVVGKLNLRICSCLACVYRVMDPRGKFGEHERCVRFATLAS